MAGLGIPVKLLHEAAGISWAHDPEKQGKVINDTIIIYNSAKVETIEQIMVLLLTVIAADLDCKSVVSHWLEIRMRTMIEHIIQVQSKVVRLFFNPGQLGRTRSIAAHYQWYLLYLFRPDTSFCMDERFDLFNNIRAVSSGQTVLLDSSIGVRFDVINCY